MMRTPTLLCLAVCSLAAWQAPGPQPSLRVDVPVPPTPVLVDGVARLVYELHLTSRAEETVRLERIAVYDAASGRPLLELEGGQLSARVKALGGDGAAADGTIPPGGRAVVYVEAELAAAAADPRRALEHEIAFAGRRGATETLRVGSVPLATTLPALAPPLRGGAWVAVYDAAWPRGHRRMVYEVDGRQRIPGRFAIDWILVDSAGRTTRGDRDIVANWLGYGHDVLAVADAVVVAARDDVPESARISTHPNHPLEDATGNFIALDLGGGRFAFYEHLQPGSVRVAVGDTVRRGQTIAALGFTGHSTGPHLHFHVADAKSPLGAEGMPYTFDCFEVLGSFDDIAALGESPWQQRRSGGAVRRFERPAPLAVVQFGCAAESDGRLQF